jgi:hypothetical protein
MDLFEYQARDVFAKHGVPVLNGIVAETPEEARAAAETLGGRAVVKAQVKIGGRGKAGGIKLANDPADAAQKAGQILNMDIRGHTVRKVMLAQTAEIADEYYVSYLLDRANRTFLAMACGGAPHSRRTRGVSMTSSKWLTRWTVPRVARPSSPLRKSERRRFSSPDLSASHLHHPARGASQWASRSRATSDTSRM